MKPTTIITRIATTSTGVSTLPMISTTADGLIVSTSTIAKNTTEKIARGSLAVDSIPMIGETPSSNVVAAVLGIARHGPIHRMIAAFRSVPAFVPKTPVTFSIEPSAFSTASTPRTARPPSAIRNDKNPVNQASPVLTPMSGGK